MEVMDKIKLEIETCGFENDTSITDVAQSHLPDYTKYESGHGSYIGLHIKQERKPSDDPDVSYGITDVTETRNTSECLKSEDVYRDCVFGGERKLQVVIERVEDAYYDNPRMTVKEENQSKCSAFIDRDQCDQLTTEIPDDLSNDFTDNFIPVRKLPGDPCRAEFITATVTHELDQECVDNQTVVTEKDAIIPTEHCEGEKTDFSMPAGDVNKRAGATLAKNFKKKYRQTLKDKPTNNRNTNLNRLTRDDMIQQSYESEYEMTTIRDCKLNLYQCQFCNDRFSQASNLNNHQIIHTGKKPYQCQFCNIMLSRKGDLKRHERIHTGEKPYQCNVCNKRFSRARYAETHQKIHMGERPYQCTEKSHQCEVCNYRFTQKGELKRHKRIHTGEKPYQCKVCSNRFSRASDLKVHDRIHTGERPYQCILCDSRFSYASSFKCHQRSHSREKPYLCEICHCRFFLADDLEVHQRIHMGEKNPYQCNFCNNRFFKPSALKRHLMTHTGEKPYQCKVCNSRFSRASDLKVHHRIHTGERPYQCTLCDSRFSNTNSFRYHQRSHCGEKPYYVNLSL